MKPGDRAARAAEEVSAWERRFAAVIERAATWRPPAGVTPREAVADCDGATLYRYAAPEGDGAPVLIVYSLVNRPFILDLSEERSLVRALRAAGHTVYLLDWGAPEGPDRWLALDDYIAGRLHAAVEHIRAAHGRSPVDLVGVCQGGTFALCYAALEPARVRRLVTLVTPVDFASPDDLLAHLARGIDFEQAAGALGNVRADWLNAVFVSLKPYRLLAERYVDLPALADAPAALEDFLRMERWMYDSPDQAGVAFQQFARDFYQANGLVRDAVTLDGRPVRGAAIEAPVLNVLALRDHLVPAAAARALRDWLPAATPYREIEFDGGHLGVFISRRARKTIFPEMVAWLNGEALSEDGGTRA